MNFLRILDLKTGLFIVLGLVTVFIYFFQDGKIKSLKDEKISILEKLVESKEALKKCDSKLNEQNQKIEDMKVEVTYIEPKTVEKIKNVFIKDSTCESELKAYKELFDE